MSRKKLYEKANGICLNKKERHYLNLENKFTNHPVHVDKVLLKYLTGYHKKYFRSPSEYYNRKKNEVVEELNGYDNNPVVLSPII